MSGTAKPLTIDFVSDIVCPWCAIGLAGLEQALAAIGDAADATIRFHPFELNPDMPAAGQRIDEHVAQKYGRSADESRAAGAAIRERAAAVGVTIAMGPDARIANSFDGHRLLHWAAEMHGAAAQRALKRALFDAYLGRGANIADHGELLAAVEAAGLDAVEASEVLVDGRYADAVRGEANYWRREGVQAVPTVVINQRYVINGGHPPELWEKALRRILAEGQCSRAAPLRCRSGVFAAIVPRTISDRENRCPHPGEVRRRRTPGTPFERSALRCRSGAFAEIVPRTISDHENWCPHPDEVRRQTTPGAPFERSENGAPGRT